MVQLSPASLEYVYMTSRRSKPMKVESPAMQEVAAGEGEGEGVGLSVFFCLAATSRGKKGKMSYFCSNASGENEESARELAALCLDHAPEHHLWHHHTVGGRRTFAFLAADDGRTYLAIADPTPGSAETVRFLEHVRDACNAAPTRRRPQDDEPAVAHVVQQFFQRLQAAARATGTSSSPMCDAVLLGDPPSELACADDKDEEARPPEEGAAARRPRRRSWVRTWWQRHAAVVIGVDVVLCLFLFGVWMAVCHGFRCVQR